jgi:hypothetical protein
MSVRKTESRIPENFQASDLGEALVAADGRCALVSFLSSPITIQRENTYVLFITDTALGAVVDSFEWMFVSNDIPDDPVVTSEGEVSYVPQLAGRLDILANLRDDSGATVATIQMTQAVQPLNRELELRILFEGPVPGPTLGNVEVAREIVNDLSSYLAQLAPPAAEAGEAYRELIYGFVRNGALHRAPDDRKTHLRRLADALNGDGFDLPFLLDEGVGVCAVRIPLLAMMPQAGGGALPLAFRELPEEQLARSAALSALVRDCASLGTNMLIDLFNQLRFPKQNITRCAGILATLRDRYFPGTPFGDVLTGFDGTRIQWLIKHFRIGPVKPA